MVLIQIRDVDTEVRDTLKARAAKEGVSFNTYLTSLLVHAAKQTPRDTVLERIAARAEAASVSSVDVIRQARDERAGHLGKVDEE
jgi:plasmid stability protein